ncbi:MAG: hypothetical protein KAI47_27870 [Deltaproteobacteria bacterium]|nr:hypothetical protein [Deltaproteobacteria bacterium]
MTLVVAIQHDDYGRDNASSPRWRSYLRERDVDVRGVNVWHHDILEQLKGAQGFMWRFAQYSDHRQVARRLLPVIEGYLDIEVYPDQKTCWHYDDKIAQAYLFEALDIPHPKTWVFFSQEEAASWLAGATFPIVSKLATGAGASNVRLLRTKREARAFVDRLFSGGVESFLDVRLPGLLRRVFRAGSEVALGRGPYSEKYWDRHKNYVLFQTFLPGNAFDTRVTVIGDRAFAFRRMNRPGDFRASGSGQIEHDPKAIDLAFVALAFSVAEKLQTQSVAIDGLYDVAGRACVGEVSYTYTSSAVATCPGYWRRDMSWHEGGMWPEEAQAADFLGRLEARFDKRI